MLEELGVKRNDFWSFSFLPGPLGPNVNPSPPEEEMENPAHCSVFDTAPPFVPGRRANCFATVSMADPPGKRKSSHRVDQAGPDGEIGMASF